MSDITKEISRMQKDINGLVSICGELKDETEEIKAENKKLKRQMAKTLPKGVSKPTLEKIKSLESMVQKLSDEQFLDRQYYNNTFTAALGLTKELRQTVAANDSH
ncbi:MAG: regulator of replication initiation timing [Psychrobacter glaciei]|jgi:regulator of replication initiation timing